MLSLQSSFVAVEIFAFASRR